MEILIGNHAVRNLIREKKTHQLDNVLTTGRKEGMRSLDTHLKELVAENIVTIEEALRVANDPQTLLLQSKQRPSPTPAMSSQG